MLKVNYKIEKIPVALSNFHKQALLSWRLIYKRGFSPTSCYLWNNENIQHKKKSLFFQTWFDRGIIWTNQIINEFGEIISYNNLITKYQIPVSYLEYIIISTAIPKGLRQLLKGSTFIQTQKIEKQVFIGQIDVTTKKCSNKFIRNNIQSASRPAAISHWNSVYGEIDFSRAWLVGKKLCINNKIEEVTFKILHNIYPAKKTLQRFKLDINYNCCFCDNEVETIPHLFYRCSYSKAFWINAQTFISDSTKQTIGLQESDILFNLKVIKDEEISLMTQVVVMLGKFHIHKRKWSDQKHCWNHFIQEFKLYKNTVAQIDNRKAWRTSNILRKFCSALDED